MERKWQWRDRVPASELAAVRHHRGIAHPELALRSAELGNGSGKHPVERVSGLDSMLLHRLHYLLKTLIKSYYLNFQAKTSITSSRVSLSVAGYIECDLCKKSAYVHGAESLAVDCADHVGAEASAASRRFLQK